MLHGEEGKDGGDLLIEAGVGQGLACGDHRASVKSFASSWVMLNRRQRKINLLAATTRNSIGQLHILEILDCRCSLLLVEDFQR